MLGASTPPNRPTAVGDARAAGFDNLSLDLMLGLPHQSLRDWQDTVTQALEWSPQHLSLYALTVEEARPSRRALRGTCLPGRRPGRDMYEWPPEHSPAPATSLRDLELGAAGLRMRHNLIYWRNETYLGLVPVPTPGGREAPGEPVPPEAYIRSVQQGSCRSPRKRRSRSGRDGGDDDDGCAC